MQRNAAWIISKIYVHKNVKMGKNGVVEDAKPPVCYNLNFQLYIVFVVKV